MDPALKPMLAQTGGPDSFPVNSNTEALWVLEPKFDGWRTIVHRTDAGAHVYGGRNASDYTGKLPYLERAVSAILPPDTVIDGELVHPKGWGGVQSTMGRSGVHQPSALDPALTLVVFDVLRIKGSDVRGLPWENRRSLLDFIEWDGAVLCLTPVAPPSIAAHIALLDQGLEGSMLKHRSSTYLSGMRTNYWLKIKAIASEDAVIVGWKESDTTPGTVGALEVELPSGVRTTAAGLTDAMKADVLANFDAKYRGKVVEVEHNGVMASGKLRHPRFKRMRDDRAPEPPPKPKPKRTAPPRTRGGPWMRNYGAMGAEKARRSLAELRARSGEAYQRCIDRGGDLDAHLRACEARCRELGLPT